MKVLSGQEEDMRALGTRDTRREAEGVDNLSTSLCSLSTMWHTRHSPAASRERAALCSSSPLLVWSCHDDARHAQSIQTAPFPGRDSQSCCLALLPL
jgi:hypothetical protein